MSNHLHTVSIGIPQILTDLILRILLRLVPFFSIPLALPDLTLLIPRVSGMTLKQREKRESSNSNPPKEAPSEQI